MKWNPTFDIEVNWRPRYSRLGIGVPAFDPPIRHVSNITMMVHQSLGNQTAPSLGPSHFPSHVPCASPAFGKVVWKDGKRNHVWFPYYFSISIVFHHLMCDCLFPLRLVLTLKSGSPKSIDPVFNQGFLRVCRMLGRDCQVHQTRLALVTCDMTGSWQVLVSLFLTSTVIYPKFH